MVIISRMALTPSASEPRAQVANNAGQITMLHRRDDRQEMRTPLDIGRDRVDGFHQIALLASASCAQFCIRRVDLRDLQHKQCKQRVMLCSQTLDAFV